MKSVLKKIAIIIDKINEFFGEIACWLCTILVAIVCFDVFNRYLFNKTNPAMYELEWHIYAVIFLLAAGFALKYDQHVRVDLTYAKFSKRTKAWVNLIGAIIALIPFCLLVIYATKDWVYQSWSIRETSPDPGGLPARYILKGCVPFGFILLMLQGISEAIKSYFFLFGSEEDKKELKLLENQEEEN